MSESGAACKCTTFTHKQDFRLAWFFLMSVSLHVIQIIETVSAVDKDEMAHRQHFTFSLAPEVAHNHNFSLKDNRGR